MTDYRTVIDRNGVKLNDFTTCSHRLLDKALELGLLTKSDCVEIERHPEGYDRNRVFYRLLRKKDSDVFSKIVELMSSDDINESKDVLSILRTGFSIGHTPPPVPQTNKVPVPAELVKESNVHPIAYKMEQDFDISRRHPFTMVNPDGLDGICGDREFMDNLYLYYKLKNKLSKSKANGNNSASDMETIQICQHYLACLGRCFSQISGLPYHDKSYKTYLDYLRWNIDIIEDQLSEFYWDDSFESYHPIICQLKEDFIKLRQECFTFSATEQGIANDYIQAYTKIHNNQDFRSILLKRAGRLFLNYVNNLAKRCYIEKIDREDVTFAQLDYESKFLIEKLSSIPDAAELAKSVGDTIQAYTDFRTFDASARVGQDDQLQHALMFAHQRATETALQSAIRTIKESIQDVMATLANRTKQVPEVTNKVTYCGILGGGDGLACAPMAVNGGRINKMKKDSEREIEEKRGELCNIIQGNQKEGKEIALEITFEEYRRQVLKDARERAEANIREMRERNEQIAEERRRQIEEMDSDALRTFESELNETANELTQRLNETQEELVRRRREIQETCVDLFSVTQGRDGAARLLQRNAARTSAPSDE